MKKFAEKKGGFCLTAEYVNRRDPLEWQCKEGHKWKASAKDILKGTWCRRCSILVITNILGPPSSIRRPDFLKIPEHPRGLELDIYYPQYGFAIEEDFEKQLTRDQLKKELCEKNSIVLRYVWYYEDPYVVIPELLRELAKSTNHMNDSSAHVAQGLLTFVQTKYNFSSIMAQTAGQLLGQTVPVCQWTPQNIPNTTSTLSAHPKFPNNVREWIGFFRAVRLNNLPPGQFPIHATSAVPLRIEDEAKTRLHTNVLFPVESLFPQGSSFIATPIGFLGASDFVLCDNNFTVAKMPVEMKTRHNLDLRGYNFWQIYRYNDRRGIMNQRFGDPRFDQNFKFKKRILSQIFGQMACNGLHYAILSNYSDTYFLKREEANQTALYISRVVQTNDVNPTLRECVYYISQLAINDNVGNILGSVELDNYSSNDDSDDSRKRKRKSKSSSIPIASSSKGITTVDKYIGGGSFGKVFSGYYDNQNVAWKTCDAYKEQEQMKTLKHEAHIYSILKECQGRDIPRLFYNGYIYDGYLFALALQLIEGAYHVDPERLTKEEKKLIVNQLKSIHNCGVLHNDISEQNILYEPKSRHYFFIDFGLSEVVGNELDEPDDKVELCDRFKASDSLEILLKRFLFSSRGELDEPDEPDEELKQTLRRIEAVKFSKIYHKALFCKTSADIFSE
ncbi:13117_t:CDS:2 [Funneliformis geosporum]|nr:13117_t:CDS:2 [Funneliformis geosporum]